ncbi:MAG: DUF2141 domain-containing protein [Gemmatimonadaceae bacterium]|nr:DUF2141 domain-containing protein [Gemmatimonadaceae bacterium]
MCATHSHELLLIRPLLAAALCLLGAPSIAAPPRATDVTLTVVTRDMRNARGRLRVALFDSTGGFPGGWERSTRQYEGAMRTPDDTVVLRGVPTGRWAVAVHHDENANGAMDERFWGAPKEGWGATRDPRPRVRPPRFAEAAITLTRDTTVVVRLTY